MNTLTNSCSSVQNGYGLHDGERDFVVGQIIANEKSEYAKYSENKRSSFWSIDDAEWKRTGERYLKIEQYISEHTDQIPTWEVAGELHYGMSQIQMRDAIKQKFKEMISLGKLVREPSLLALIDRTSFYPEEGRRNEDLTRIWGAQFLNSKLPQDSKIKAAEHYLVVDGKETEIEVEVIVGRNDYPVLSIVRNAHVLAKKIVGDKKAWDYRSSSELDSLKYRDFTDSGNIICDSDGIAWVVDTEIKSFDPPILNTKGGLIQDYLKKRFRVLNDSNFSIRFKINLDEIGLYRT